MRNASRKMESTLPNNISWKQINWIHINRYVEELHVPFLGEEVPVTGLTYPTCDVSSYR